ncbi:hypothetical protein Tco_0164234 [Tanacetum coccineum]
MGSEAIEVPTLKEEEFAQVIVIGVHVSFPNGKSLSFVLSFNTFPRGNPPKTNRSEDSTRRFPCFLASFFFSMGMYLFVVLWDCASFLCAKAREFTSERYFKMHTS